MIIQFLAKAQKSHRFFIRESRSFVTGSDDGKYHWREALRWPKAYLGFMYLSLGGPEFLRKVSSRIRSALNSDQASH